MITCRAFLRRKWRTAGVYSTSPPLLCLYEANHGRDNQSTNQTYCRYQTLLLVENVFQIGGMQMIQPSVANFHWKYTTNGRMLEDKATQIELTTKQIDGSRRK